MPWTKVLLLVFVSVTCGQPTVLPNEAVDKLLTGIETQVHKSIVIGDTIVPDVAEKLALGDGVLSLDFLVTCKGGNISALSGIRRVSDVKVVAKERGHLVKTTLMIEKMEVTFSMCFVKMALMRSNGPFQLTGGNILMDLHIYVEKQGDSCKNEVARMHVSRVRDVEAKMGGGITRRLKSMIAGYVARKSHAKVVDTMNKNIQSTIIKTEIEKINFCQYLMSYLA